MFNRHKKPTKVGEVNLFLNKFCRRYAGGVASAVAAKFLLCLFGFLLAADAFAVPAPAGVSIRAQATASYIPAGISQTETASSNVVIATIMAVEAATLGQTQAVTRAPGANVVFSHVLANIGNVPSSYTVNLVTDGPGCSKSNIALGSAQVLRDTNNNGVADAADSVLALDAAGVLDLSPGQSTALLVTGNLPVVPSGNACVALTITTKLQNIVVTNQDSVAIGNGAVMLLSKSAQYSGPVVPGQTRIDFNITATNVGGQDARPTGNLAPTGSALFVDGRPSTLVLLRDVIPVGAQYVVGSLQTTAAKAVRLYRRPGDPEFTFQTTEDRFATEVAIGLPTSVVTNASISMQFATTVIASHSGDIRNTAQSYYNDGVSSVVAASNTVVIGSNQARLGVAKEASTPVMNRGADGAPDGTATVQFRIHLRSYGSAWLYDIQATDLLEGAEAGKFGAYTTAAIPAAGHYTILPGSMNVTGNPSTTIDRSFNGTAANQNLLAPGSSLSPGAEAVVQFDVRVNLTGRTAALTNVSKGIAAIVPGGTPSVRDDSVDGANPDPDGDGDPNNNSSATVVSTQLPVLSLVKSASLPRRIGAGIYQLDYTLRVTNSGGALAPNVRLIDNLNCALANDLRGGTIREWELIGTPRVRNGYLAVSPGFTGKAQCNRTKEESTDAFNPPTELVLSLTDGSRSLGAGQSEEVTFTVQVTTADGTGANRVLVTNKGWAVAFDKNTVGFTSANVVAAATSTVQSVLTDPQGTVYDAVSRMPVAGAVVTYTRQSCSGGTAGPISPGELFGGAAGVYSFNSNGSVSMTTGGDGAYQFFLKSPPVSGLCTYGVSVIPPAGSAYLYPSELIPVSPGTFATCGLVVPNAGAPKGGDPTTYFTSVVAGINASGGAACEVVHNHIPLDPGNIRGLTLRKEGSKRQAELGDFLEYALTVTNKTGASITGFSFDDRLPPGFGYVSGSARMNGAVASDPKGGSGPTLTFGFPEMQLAADASATLRYRVRIGVGAPTNGDAVNRATVRAGPLTSNLAIWTVRVSGGVFSDEAFAFGKVYLDCKRDGVQGGADELGIPGVRLYLENGTFVITDVEGKWSFYGLKPITHVLRVDESTLPLGAKLAVLDSRNAGNPASRFVDLVKGEFHKADFIVQSCEKAITDEVMSRRTAIGANPATELEAQLRTRLDAEGRTQVVGDTRGMPASGQSSGIGMIGPQLGSSAPLIALPSGASGTSGGFVGAAGANGGTLGAISNGMAPQAGSLFNSVAGVRSTAKAASITSGSAVSPGALDTRSGLTSGAMLEPRSVPLLPAATPSPIELEAALASVTVNALGFVGLEDGDTVPNQSINVQVKGETGSTFRLTVDGVEINEKRVGKKATFAARDMVAWEYIGVLLKAGKNRLEIAAFDGFGNPRGNAVAINVVAPDKLGAIDIVVPESARADLRSPISVRVRLKDAAGVPVTARTQVTLESDRGRWLVDDMNPNEPGAQVFMEGGQAEFQLLPPGEPGNARLRVSAADLVEETSIALLPELRPMIGVGIVEGILDFSKRGGLPIGAMPAGAAFEAELSSLGGDSSRTRASGRAAFFFKGAVKGEYLLTAALDTDKRQKDRLFRDIRPDEFYPVYGDSAVKGFDAQSTQKLYVRIDKNRSYLLYGDFTTASSQEVRSLSQTNRTLTGMKNVYEDEKIRATTYVARTSQSQQIEEFRALGTSGPYYLSATGGEFIDNSDQIEIVVRDRNQPNVVLQRTPVVRFIDYTVESLTRRILFTRPIASVDANLNPQSIRVTYEVDSGGAKFVVAGTDVQLRVTDRLQLGVVANTDQNDANQRDLTALTALARVGDNTTVAAELVRTHSDERGSGGGGRIELRHQDEKLAVVALASKTSSTFDNPGASFSAGHTDVSARAELKIDPTLALRAETLYSKDALLTHDRKGATVSAQKKLSDNVVVEAGVRHGQSATALGTSAGFDYGRASTYNNALGSNLSAGNTTFLGAAAAANAQNDDLTTLRGRVSVQVPEVKGLQAFVEAEQDVKASDRHTVAIGANYALTDKSRAYGRYELISSLYGPYSLASTQTNNIGVLGIESAYMEGGRVYNEYRLADSIDGRSAATAIGVRNTVQVSPRIRLTGGIEHTRNLSGASNSVNTATGYSNSRLGESTALTGGAEYQEDGLKASGVLEARNGSDATTRLFSAGVGYKVNPEVSVLARSVVSDSVGQGASGGNERLLQRHQVGVAYRPVDTNVWNALARYEYKGEKVVGGGNASGAAIGTGSTFGNSSGNAVLPGKYTANIFSAHLNVNPQRGLQITSRYAAKVSHADDGSLVSRYWAQLLQGRVIQDINQDWDIGLQIGALYGQGGALQKTLGAEIGYQVYRDMWVSGGYNFVGLSDRDLTANEYTSKGAYVRMRVKFDETAFGSAPVNGETPRASAPSPASVQVPESLVRQPDAPALEMAPQLGAPVLMTPVEQYDLPPAANAPVMRGVVQR